ncbi:MAG TPA: nuclear transport factor 2 family protein [Burkholderiales bacterium]
MSGNECVGAALEHFVRIFNDLDWEAFADCFADDAAVYAPFPDQPRIAVGKAALEAGWRPVFDRVRANRPGPPYLNIDPKDTRVRSLGEDACVVTFHLENLVGATRLHRRTAVFERRDGRWRIVHLHASVASETM